MHYLLLIFIKIRRIYRKIKSVILTFIVKKEAHKYGQNLKVNGYSRVSKNTLLGDNVSFNGMRIMGGGNVGIGNNFHSGENCLMFTEVHNYDYGKAVPYDDTYLLKDITIEDNVWLGSRVIIMGGVNLGEGSIIQAGSVVVSNIPKYAIAGGHPAKVFKYRDVDHYETLKQKGKFH